MISSSLSQKSLKKMSTRGLRYKLHGKPVDRTIVSEANAENKYSSAKIDNINEAILEGKETDKNGKNFNFNNLLLYIILSFLLIIVLIIIFIFLKNLFNKIKSKKYHPQIDDTSQSQKKGKVTIEIK